MRLIVLQELNRHKALPRSVIIATIRQVWIKRYEKWTNTDYDIASAVLGGMAEKKEILVQDIYFKEWENYLSLYYSKEYFNEVT